MIINQESDILKSLDNFLFLKNCKNRDFINFEIFWNFQKNKLKILQKEDHGVNIHIHATMGIEPRIYLLYLSITF